MVWLGIRVLGAGYWSLGTGSSVMGGAFFAKSAIYRAGAPVANYHYLVRDCLVRDCFGWELFD